jgi:hypothetical protein
LAMAGEAGGKQDIRIARAAIDDEMLVGRHRVKQTLRRPSGRPTLGKQLARNSSTRARSTGVELARIVQLDR